MILQDAMSAFDPLYTVGYQMIETLVENKNLFKKEAKKVSIKTLEKMNINAPQEVVKKYPHQLSGGMLKMYDSIITIYRSRISLLQMNQLLL